VDTDSRNSEYRRRDHGVRRRHDLRTVILATQVHLVAVVGGGIVARRHHHTGTRAEEANRERQNGRGKQPGQKRGFDTRAGEDLCGVQGESTRILAAVVADDRGRMFLAGAQVRGKSASGLRDEHAVHPVRAGTEFAPEARCAELQPAGESVVQVGQGSLGPVRGSADEVVELSVRFVVGILVSPGPSDIEQCRHRTNFPITADLSCERTRRASGPAITAAR
jgi:hypothetical protein